MPRKCPNILMVVPFRDLFEILDSEDEESEREHSSEPEKNQPSKSKSKHHPKAENSHKPKESHSLLTRNKEASPTSSKVEKKSHNSKKSTRSESQEVVTTLKIQGRKNNGRGNDEVTKTFRVDKNKNVELNIKFSVEGKK